MEAKRCPSCGADNRSGASFCVKCGKHLPATSPGPAPGPPARDTPPEPTQPVPGPPPPAAPARSARRGLVAALVLVLLVGGGAVAFVVAGGDEAEAVVIYEPPLEPGDAPFTAATDVPADQVGAEIPTPAPDVVDPGSAGAGPFGGTGSNTVCDRELLISALRNQPDRLAAWLAVLEVTDADFEDFVRGLTPVTLAVDTRVTNHTFEGGAAVAFQSILPAGTAVLVDADGMIRVRCRCGNPILEPVRVGTAVCQGCPQGYTPPAPQPPGVAAIFVVVINPPPVAAEPEATPEPTATAAPQATTPPSPTPGPTPTPAPQVTNLSSGAQASASSTYSSDFPPRLSIDGDTGTSWFSSGPGQDGTSAYTITLAHASTVTQIQFVGNEHHRNTQFRQGFGFRSWRIELLASGRVVRTINASGSGTQSQNHDVPGLSEITEVRFVGWDHEDPTCGGFAELRVMGY